MVMDSLRLHRPAQVSAYRSEISDLLHAIRLTVVQQHSVNCEIDSNVETIFSTRTQTHICERTQMKTPQMYKRNKQRNHRINDK